MRSHLIKGMMVAMAAAILLPGKAAFATESTEAVTESVESEAAETQTEITNVDAKEYILLLPVKDGVTYGMDESHVSSQYSSANYTVLLYKEGEQVDISVSGASEFYIADALTVDGANIADGADGKISFVMPAQDLTLTIPSWAIVTETESNTAETQGTDETQAADGTVGTAVAGSDIRVSLARLNVRSAAVNTSEIIGWLKPGDRIKVTGTEGDWLAVKFVKDGAVVDGYVFAKYTAEISSLYTAVSDTIVYSAASDTASQVGQLMAGSEIVVQETGTDGWSSVVFELDDTEINGYVKTESIAAETSPTVDALLS